MWKGMLLALLLAFAGVAADWFPVQFESPNYPLLANQARIEGVVRLRLVLGADGRVLRSEPLSGNSLLARAAEANALTWRFARSCSEETTSSSIDFIYSFTLEGEAPDRPTVRFSYEHPYRVRVVSQALHWTPDQDGRK